MVASLNIHLLTTDDNILLTENTCSNVTKILFLNHNVQNPE